MVRLFLLLFLFCALTLQVKAQGQRDSLSMLHSPKRASIMSALIPGAGQFYNRKYWKIPVIYAGFAGLGYFVKTNHDDYTIYKNAYRIRLDGDETTIDEFDGIYADQDLVTLKDYYRRNRDLSIIGIGLLYVLNIVDAAVDAHLFYFNVGDELTMQVIPGYNPALCEGPSVRFNIHF